MSAEIILASLTFLMPLMYHLHLIHHVRTTPIQTLIGLANHVRIKWERSVMERNLDLLAVQTLRNRVMASSFVGSTSALIVPGTPNLASTSGKA